uniref:Uncharacterized protein n=1 Tax=Timema poppense TaxID=170557 RepID=A0A7R9D7U3_TIMPO|nr:unnamed protein product [Timema poppensis]
MTVVSVTLSSGQQMPLIGLGTWQSIWFYRDLQAIVYPVSRVKLVISETSDHLTTCELRRSVGHVVVFKPWRRITCEFSPAGHSGTFRVLYILLAWSSWPCRIATNDAFLNAPFFFVHQPFQLVSPYSLFLTPTVLPPPLISPPILTLYLKLIMCYDFTMISNFVSQIFAEKL